MHLMLAHSTRHPHFGRSARCPFVVQLDSAPDVDVHNLGDVQDGIRYSSQVCVGSSLALDAPCTCVDICIVI